MEKKWVTSHHWNMGYKAALRGRPMDKRKRGPENSAAYKRGHAEGRKMFERAVNHGMVQKFGD